jgi:Erythromycin esterase
MGAGRLIIGLAWRNVRHRPWQALLLLLALSLSTTSITPSAGYLLRQYFAMGYRSVGLTFGSGPIPQLVPPPPPGSLEARLDPLSHPTVLVVPRASGLRGAHTVRIVGPNYEPRDDPRHVMAGDLERWFDVVLHQKTATSAHFLT